MLKKWIYSIFALMVINSCGQTLDQGALESTQEKAETTASQSSAAKTPGDASQTPNIEVDVTVYEGSSVGFGLTTVSASAYELSLGGCVSGFDNGGSKFTEASPSISMYQNDQNCLLKLDSFTYSGAVYVPSAGDPFATHLPGDEALFENSADSNDTLLVVVTSQLTSPISAGPESVSYTFNQVAEGSASSIVDVSDAHNISISGLESPSFNVHAVGLIASNAITATGAGLFDVELECSEALADSDTTCKGQVIANMDYVLIDTDSLTDVTASGLESHFSGGQQSATADASVNANGGFKISSIQGPDSIHLNPMMSLIIRVTNGSNKSYTYFDINVTTL